MQVSIQQINNQDDLDKVLELRREVFCGEQKVTEAEEIDSYDNLDNEQCIHFGLYVENECVSCLRLIISKWTTKIGRVATKKEYRKQGLMSKLFEYVISYIYYEYPKVKYIELESQLHAIVVYNKFGFKEYGEVFLDANIEHKKMNRQNISPFLYSTTNKRYYTVNQDFKNKYQQKVGRVMLDAGFTCPNIDGSKGTGGCSFCSIHGSGDFAGKRGEDLLLQFQKNYERLHQKWEDSLAIAYFQAYSNTYSSLDNLIDKFEVFKNVDSCIGIAIGTRPDCIDEQKVKYLAELNKEIDVYVELGLQTINEESARLFNRGYELDTFTKAAQLLNSYGLKPIVHIINGLPNDSVEDNLNIIKYLNQFDLGGIKIHMLHVMKKTKMGKEYLSNPWKLLSKQEYIEIVCRQIALLKPEIVVHRVTGDAPSDMLIAPTWTIDKTTVLNDIDKRLVALKIHQGINYES